jgi:hypothetical protein
VGAARVGERAAGGRGRRVELREVLRDRQAGERAGARGTLQVLAALDPLLGHVPAEAVLRLVVAEERGGDVALEVGARLRLGAEPVGAGVERPLLVRGVRALLGADPDRAVVGRAGRAGWGRPLLEVGELGLAGDLGVEAVDLGLRAGDRGVRGVPGGAGRVDPLAGD